jgi:hypothetical protein
MQEIRVEMESDMKKLKYDMDKLVSAKDMQINFRALSDLLFVKFTQLENMKQALRDVLVFQKYFYPLQMQMLITTSMDSLEAAQEDLDFQRKQEKRYEMMLNKIEKARDEAFKKKDDEFERHKVDLEKRYLKEADWITEPLENPKNNFFEPLIKEYVKDIEIRNTFEVNQKEGFTRVIRKNCPLDSVENLILEMY